jgi:AraC-like DNA-binding protein
MTPSADQNKGTGEASLIRPHVGFSSKNLERTRQFLFENNIQLDVTRRDASNLSARVTGIYLPDSMYVGSTEYGARASVQVTPQRVDYWLLIPLHGRMETSVRGHQYVSDARRAFLFSYPAMGPSRIEVDAGAVRMTVVLSNASLQRQLAALLGKPPDAPLCPPLEFAPVMDVASGYGRSIARLAYVVLTQFERGAPLARNPVALASLEQFVVNQLLLSHPHNYSGAIYTTGSSVAPRDVKRAIDYIEANLTARVRLPDIVAAADVPGRTLLKHFARFRGVSPMEYLRAARFEAVRRALLDEATSDAVADVAVNWGFSHMGRFSAEYRKRFGERPSETRRRLR